MIGLVDSRQHNGLCLKRKWRLEDPKRTSSDEAVSGSGKAKIQGIKNFTLFCFQPCLMYSATCVFQASRKTRVALPRLADFRAVLSVKT